MDKAFAQHNQSQTTCGSRFTFLPSLPTRFRQDVVHLERPRPRVQSRSIKVVNGQISYTVDLNSLVSKGVLRLYQIALNSNIFESTSVRSCLQVAPGYLLESKEHYRCKLLQSQLFLRSSRSIHDEKRKAVNHISLNKIYVTY